MREPPSVLLPTMPGPPRNPNHRFGWYRVYEDFCGHPKWIMVAARSGVQIAYVEAIVQRMFQAASKARADGHIGGFDVEVCAAGAGIPAEQVAVVFRVLNEVGFLQHSTIVDWADRNPRDKTSTDRQRNKRAKDDARRAFAAGTATPMQVALLSIEEREALSRLLDASRVTEQPAAAKVEVVAPFMLLGPAEDSAAAREVARLTNDRAARLWLLGDGVSAGYGPASWIVAENFDCSRINGDGNIRRWLQNEMGGNAVALATIISQVFEHALSGDGFRAAVEQRIADYQRERTAGPTLPFGISALKGGRA
jgi:hypothetical protein